MSLGFGSLAELPLSTQPATASGVTGTSATTNANDTSSASGTTTIVGTSSTTNANDVSAASGTTTIICVSATTNADDTSTASGTVGGGGVSGTAATTNADDVAAASGTAASVGAPHLIWGSEEFRKKYYSPLIRKLRREVPDEVFQIIEEVAAPTVAETPKEARLTLAQQELLLKAELKAQGIAWRKAYREVLAEMIAQEDEDRAILMLMGEL